MGSTCIAGGLLYLVTKKVEELHSMKSRIFLESTRIYHFPLFYHLKESGFEVFVINPLITNSIKNLGIRKVKNDKLDSIGIAKLGLNPNLKTSLMPEKLMLELRTLTRKYYDLTDERAFHVIRLKTALHTVFPQYLDLFSDVVSQTSKMILRHYLTPAKILRAHRKTMIERISKTSRKGIDRATSVYDKLTPAATTFGCPIESVYFNISMTLGLIE